MSGRFLFAGVAGVAYIAVSQWLMTRAPASGWGAGVVVAPMLLVAAWLAWQRGWRVAAALLGLGSVGLVASAALGWNWAPTSLYIVQHVAIHLLLASAFALTLQRGRMPLITLLAAQVHATLTPDMRAYCRKVTLAWAIYFVAMAALSLVLYAALPFEAWATFANLLTPIAVAAMFVGEYLLRYRLHPEFERATLRQAIRAYTDRRATAAVVPLAVDSPTATSVEPSAGWQASR